jgi:signal transduction histidine kinase
VNKLIDKVIIFILSMVLYLVSFSNPYLNASILMVVIFSAALSYLEAPKVIAGIFILVVIGSFFDPILLIFVPLMCYDVIFFEYKWLWALALLPLAVNFNQLPEAAGVLLLVFVGIAYFLKRRTLSLEKIKKDYILLQDNARETALQLEKRNKNLMEKQDYELNLATLTERNRIARDIHDNVGHMLSRSILQTGALMAVTRDEATREGLLQIKTTLSEAMDSIRNSVHDLHEESLDLEMELRSLINHFEFCPVTFDYDVESSLDKDLKYCFIAVVKEALSNIIRHSNATTVNITVREHPALYQLVVQDNGTTMGMSEKRGIGLTNISDRVDALNGNVNISTENGFRIFISIPKQT